MTATMIICTIVVIALTVLNGAIFYLTTRARRARRGITLSPQNKTAAEAPHIHTVTTDENVSV